MAQDMNKTDFITQVAEVAGISKADAKKAVDASIELVTKTLSEGGKISFVGFGTFKVGERAARTGRNPQTGAEMQIPAAKVPKFAPGKSLKDACNE